MTLAMVSLPFRLGGLHMVAKISLQGSGQGHIPAFSPTLHRLWRRWEMIHGVASEDAVSAPDTPARRRSSCP